MTEKQTTLVIFLGFFLILTWIASAYDTNRRTLDYDLMLQARLVCPKCQHEFKLEKSWVDKLKEKL